MVSAPFIANFMLPVPEASLPAVEICSDRSAAGKIALAVLDVEVGQEDDPQAVRASRVGVHHLGHRVDRA